MTEREMLELAAKAAGKKHYGEYCKHSGLKTTSGWWDPRNNETDALRLAMRLNMCVSIHDNHCMACAQKGEVQVVKDVPTEEAVLLAITRAAAEIGKQMGGGDV